MTFQIFKWHVCSTFTLKIAMGHNSHACACNSSVIMSFIMIVIHSYCQLSLNLPWLDKVFNWLKYNNIWCVYVSINLSINFHYVNLLILRQELLIFYGYVHEKMWKCLENCFWNHSILNYQMFFIYNFITIEYYILYYRYR